MGIRHILQSVNLMIVGGELGGVVSAADRASASVVAQPLVDISDSKSGSPQAALLKMCIMTPELCAVIETIA
jgi:hypothetical protein